MYFCCIQILISVPEDEGFLEIFIISLNFFSRFTPFEVAPNNLSDPNFYVNYFDFLVPSLF